MAEPQSRAAWAPAHGAVAMAREIDGLLDCPDAARIARALARPG